MVKSTTGVDFQDTLQRAAEGGRSVRAEAEGMVEGLADAARSATPRRGHAADGSAAESADGSEG